MNSRKVVVHGSYFMNNFGDTLLVKLLCDRIAEHVGKENVMLGTEGLQPEQQSIGYPVVKETEIHSITDVFYSGGGYFGEPGFSWLRKWRWALRNYKRHFTWNKPFSHANFHIIGVGVGPLTNSFYKHLVGKFLGNCDTILVRDNESFDYCSKYYPKVKNIGTCVDMALSTPNLRLKKEKVCVHLDTSDDNVIENVLEVLNRKECFNKDHKLSIIFDNNISFGKKSISRYESALKLAGFSQSDYEFIEYQDMSSLIGILSASKLVITSKLHVGIVTISQEGKAIAIPNHSKTKRLYSQMGVSKFCIEREGFTSSKFEDMYDNIDDFKPNYSVRDSGIELIDNKIKKIFSN